jgi:integrase
MTMYELRHACVSLLLSRGESIAAVSQMLGHKSAKTTLQFYARALPKDLARLAEAMDGLLERGRGAR